MENTPIQSENSLVGRYLYEVIGRLFIELKNEQEKVAVHQKISLSRKEQIRELYKEEVMRRDAEWEIMRLQKLLKNAGIDSGKPVYPRPAETRPAEDEEVNDG